MKIYIKRADQRAGPYTLAQVNAFLHMGRLTSEDFAWYEGCLNWVKVKGIPGVKVVAIPGKKTTPPITRPQPTVVKPVAHVQQPVMNTAPIPVARVEQSVMKTAPSFGSTAPAITRPVYTAGGQAARVEQTVMQIAPQRGARAPRMSITCRICESGELKKSILPRFSRSIITLGRVLFTMSVLGMIAILLSMIPFHAAVAGTPAVTIMIGGAEPVRVDPFYLGTAITNFREMILANWEFLFICSLVGLILFFLFRSKKRVLQCNRCESVVAIE